MIQPSDIHFNQVNPYGSTISRNESGEMTKILASFSLKSSTTTSCFRIVLRLIFFVSEVYSDLPIYIQAENLSVILVNTGSAGKSGSVGTPYLLLR